MLFKVGQYLAFIIAHNKLLCAIIGDTVGTIENTILLYLFLWSFIGAYTLEYN